MIVLPEYCDEVLIVAEDPDKKTQSGCVFPYVYTDSFIVGKIKSNIYTPVHCML